MRTGEREKIIIFKKSFRGASAQIKLRVVATPSLSRLVAKEEKRLEEGEELDGGGGGERQQQQEDEMKKMLGK